MWISRRAELMRTTASQIGAEARCAFEAPLASDEATNDEQPQLGACSHGS